MASVEHAQQWEWPIQRFGARRYVEEYRFVNLDQVLLHEAYEAFVQGVEQIFDHLGQLFEPDDYAQLRLEAISMHDSPDSPTINLSNVNTEKLLDWVFLLLIMLIMRKRVALIIALFHVASKVFIHLPLLVFQPFWTFFALIFFWTYWITVVLFLGTTGSPVPNEEGFVEFQMVGPLKYMWWYHVVGLIWISEFILACQQMTVAGAVVTYYFTREKRNLPFTPILASVNRLICYHLGTVAKGSFIIALVKIPRMILMYIHTQLKGKESAFARYVLKACICCLWCLENCLTYLNQNAYTATAINSTNFCTSAKDAFVILVENALRVAAINTVGDFMLFLGKILIVCSTGLAGFMLLNYQQDYTIWVLPLIIVCLFAFLVAHCFLSIYEIVIDVLFLCFAIDAKYNDGSPGREFYMDKVLMDAYPPEWHGIAKG
nr:PREDICTED: choline transporter-like protein 1 [Apteryx mantelli mantelli]